MRKLSRIKLPCAAFAAVGTLCFVYFAIFGFYPFGDRSVVWCDLEQQYLPLLMELRGILRDGGSLFLGRGGGGMNLWGVLLFFVSSPLGLLSLFVSEDKMIYFINILTVLKLALCGASASFFFGRIFQKLPNCFNILLSVMYSLSGYGMMYCQNNMWLDVMIIFPLLLWSEFRLCEKGKWLSYAVLLSFIMLLNFYLSYMIVIFILISFAVMLFFCCEREVRGSCAVKFVAGDICAALVTAPVWLPAMIQYTSSGRGGAMSSGFASGGFFYNFADKLAILSCTSFVIASVLTMLMRLRLFRRGRSAFFAVMTLVMLMGAFIEPINKLWHTGSYQAYPLRYGFIIILLALSVGAVLLSEKKMEEKRKESVILPAVPVIFGVVPVMVYAAANHKKFNSYISSLWISGDSAKAVFICGAVGTAAYLLLTAFYNRGISERRITAVMMWGIVVCESLFGFSVYFGNINDVTSRFEQTMELSGKIDDDEFCRVKSCKRYFYSNMLEAMGFSSIGHYTSLTDGDFLFAAKRLGYSAYWMDISSNGGNLITDAFLMNKYFVGQSSDKNGFFEDYDTDGILKIYRNTAVLDGALISAVSPAEIAGFTETERMESSEYIAEKLWGVRDILQKAEPYACCNLRCTEENGKISVEIVDPDETAYLNYSFFVSGRQELYADLFGNYSTALKEPYSESVSIYVNGTPISLNYPNKKENGIVDIGTFENKYVSVKIIVHKSFEASSFGVYLMDADKAEECIKSADTGRIELEGSKIKITASSPDGGYVYIPFAFSDGYSAVLNGRKTSICRAFEDFMAVELDKGENELVLSFRPKGLAVGMVMSVLGILSLIIAWIFGRRIKIPRRFGKVVSAAVFILSAAVFAVVYIFSSAAWIAMQFIG